ncbi:MAG: Trk system potassium transporter TrkA [Gammaproteobacteria bacterium]|nr:Trk system potassium transporter TrkA [Gammaproteobacteria bacterium]MDH3374434.1 Trk system potassium transporter TrkA [Gammaproteobacteria bacterium]MDH3408553.1 Trk system potassium transporter TrkA [Gammaproteobacteria bacterium]
MKILILGAGQVGSSAAYHLSREEANDVTVVDTRADVLRELQDRLDIRTVVGHAASPDVLDRAGANDADIVVALTDTDETNMVACQVAYTLFHTPTKIARIRSADYMSAKGLFTQDAIPVDVRISPEQLVCQYVEQLILYPGASHVLDFADGRVRLVGVRADRDGLLVGQRIATLKEHLPNTEGRIAAIYRKGKAMLPEGDTVIQEDDEVFFIADRKDIRVFMSEIRRLEDPVRRVVIAGGGNIGVRLALALEQTNQVKIIERDPKRARYISEQLNKAIVLVGDAADEELLIEENIDNVDVFCAITNSEEANILSSMLAKRLGSHKVMALINRASYVDLVEAGSIDIAISPQQITIGSLLAHVRRGDVVKVHSLRRGAAEAIEAIAHGDERESKVVGRKIEDIDLPKGAAIVTLVREGQVIIAHHDTIIQTDDHVIMFLTDRRKIENLEKLFQVGVSFI